MTSETKTLYELTREAADQVAKYRYPDIGEWINRIDDVLRALGEPRICSDTVVAIEIGDNEVLIDTSYFVRGCYSSNSMYVPISVIIADDPIKAAEIYSLQEQRGVAARCLQKANDEVKRYGELIVSLEKQLKELE